MLVVLLPDEGGVACLAVRAASAVAGGPGKRAKVWVDHRFGPAASIGRHDGPCLISGVRGRPGSSDFILDFRGVPLRRHLVPVTLGPDGTWVTSGVRPQGGAAWTHLDLACGIGGFTVAAHRLGG